jgi:hypothetical protein
MADIDFYYPFDSIDGDRKTTAATERRFFAALFTDGVVGADAFKAEQVSAGVYRIGAGVAIVKGAIGGIVNAKQITAKPALGAVMHIVLRLDTTNGGRKVTLEAVASMESDSVEQLEQGGMHDLPLYTVEGTSGGYVLTDKRAYCTSFDNSVYSQDFQALYDGARNDTEALLDALRVNIAGVLAEANADTAGMYGSAGRQGFINPNWAVNQRGGSSYTVLSGRKFIYDHWAVEVTGRAAYQTIPVYKLWDGLSNRLSLQIQNKTYGPGSAAAASFLAQTIEGGVFDFCNGGGKFTVSFDAKASAPQRLAVDAMQNVGGASERIPAQVVNVTTEWQRFSLTFEGTMGTASNDGGDWLKVAFYFAWANNAARFGEDQNAANTVDFANMQINKGTTPLPCYEPPYAEQLHQCQRYYCKLDGISLPVGATLAATNQVFTGPIPMPRKMYRVPSVIVSDRANGLEKASAEIAAGGWRNGLACVVSDASGDNPALAVTNTDASAVTRVAFNSIELNAEINS